MHSATKMLLERLRAIQRVLKRLTPEGGDAQAASSPAAQSLLRKISALVGGLPAMDNAKFEADYLSEFNDTLLTVYLACMTQVGARGACGCVRGRDWRPGSLACSDRAAAVSSAASGAHERADDPVSCSLPSHHLQGVHTANELVDKSSMAYDRSARRRGLL